VVDEPGRPAPRGETEEHIHDLWTVANVITVLRLMLVPIFLTVILSDRSDALAFVLFVAAASTDWLDGQIARRTGTVTVIGKAIDPLVDRLLIASGLIGLYIENRLPAWIMVVLIMRDVYLLYGAWRLERHRLRMPVTRLGKATTAVLLAGFSLLILNWPQVAVAGKERLFGLYVVYVGLALSMTTAVQYTVRARRLVTRGVAEQG
jgi:cardiolipin synthase